jgi:hypothetical protein
VNISAESRRRARGVFVGEQRKVYWIYQDVDARNVATDATYDQVMVLDLNIGGFYFYSIASDTDYPELRSLTFVAPLADSTTQEVVTTTTGETVFLNDGVTPITSERSTRTAQITQLKLLTLAENSTLGGWGVTFSEFNDRSFHDWRFSEIGAGVGLNYVSYVEFGYNTFGSNHTSGKPVYVHSFFSTTSKNLASGGYYELPPVAPDSDGYRVSQSVLEILHKGQADMSLDISQSVLETLHKGDGEFTVSQTVIEVLHEVV